MQRTSVMLTLFLALGAATAEAARLQTTPMARVVGLLTELEAKIEADGKLEQKSYDKYACWCEATLGRKANDIANAKEKIADLQTLIVKLKAEIASHGAEIANLKKDIAKNLDEQREATELRDKENADYEGEKTESEQCIGALEAAINVLTGAGEGRPTKFLQSSMQEAQLLSVVSGVRGVLKSSKAQSVAGKDLEMVKRFVEHPENFVSASHAGFMSATQISNNPFGDYAPQSTQIQGILKGMYDAFASDLEKDNGEESDSQKAYEELMKTKQDELETLQSTLAQQELEEAQKSKTLADSETLQDDTKEQLKEDEAFFEETKEECQTKASEWAERTRLRTEELMGIGKAIEIMSGPEAQKIFMNATTTFVQLASGKNENSAATSARSTVFSKLRSLAGKNHNVAIAEIAATVKTGDHFDKVMLSIDAMIAELRKEEADDIAHRDRCQRAENKNANEMEDLNAEITKSGNALKRMADKENELKTAIKTLKGDITSTKGDMKDLLEMRNEAVDEFKQAQKDDTAAIMLMEKALTALTAFYKRNKISMAMVQKANPEYTVDADKAPELSYEGPKYGGRKSETSGLVAIMSMLIEDLEKEVKQGILDNEEAEAQYEKQRGALKKTLDAQTQSKIATEKELVELQGKMNDVSEYGKQKMNDLGDETELQGTIGTDCAWVATHFDSRREKRKAEIDGLEDAKNFLAGSDEPL